MCVCVCRQRERDERGVKAVIFEGWCRFILRLGVSQGSEAFH